MVFMTRVPKLVRRIGARTCGDMPGFKAVAEYLAAWQARKSER